MIKKALFVGAIGLVAVMAAFGLGPLGRGATPTGALIGIPLQPFAPDWSGNGINTSQLGDTNTGGRLISNQIVGSIRRGQRIALPYIYADPTSPVPLDMDAVPGPGPANKIGDVGATLDVMCDSPADGASNDQMYASLGPPMVPWDWNKITTAVQGSSDSFLYALVPPYPWLLRDRAVVDHFYVAGASVSAAVVLNTVFNTVPWSANGGGNTATTKNGGDARVWTAATDGLCIDTPQDSVSHTWTNYAQPLLGDTGGACTDANCADATVYGPIGKNTQTGAGTVTVTDKYLNKGPNAGTYLQIWIIEVFGVANANFVTGGGKSLSVPESLAVGTTVDDPEDIAITCPSSGWGLIVVKNVLIPVSPTVERYALDNAGVLPIQVNCSGAGTGEDLSVTQVRPIHVTSPSASKPEQINLLNTGQSATVTIRDVDSNNATTTQTADWYIDVEVLGGQPLTVSLSDDASRTVGSNVEASDCTPANSGCNKFSLSMDPGQSDLKDDLTITCPAASPAGRYFVVVKIIIVRTSGGVVVMDSKPADNAQRLVIPVNCWSSMPAGDGTDDGTGLFPKWVIALSNPDSRQDGNLFASPPPYGSLLPPSFPQDGGPDSKLQQPIGTYVERVLQVGCYFETSDGCKTSSGGGSCDTNADGYLTAAETQRDYRYNAATMDPDGDCLQSAATAQPGHPVDLPTLAGTCDPVPWAMTGGPAQVTYTMDADHDCDGLPDGVEVAWGSNPMVADTDGDGAPDYVEMFDFTSPVNADTDSDGFLDKPSSVFGDNTDKSMDNCPTISNADGPSGNSQLNTDGKHRSVGASIPAGKASNPNKDKLGDACDPDNDNDGLPDAVEGVMGTVAKGLQGDGTPSYDTDGDHCVDGSEVLTGSDPTLATSKCPTGVYFTLAMAKFFRACHWNLPILSTDTGGEAKFQQWDAKYSSNTDRAELDPDHDGVDCQTPDLKIGDKDNDSGPATYADVPDIVEIEGYNTNPANKDTDGDGCEDFVQINDLNGSGAVDTTDLLIVATYINKLPPAVDKTSFEVIDVNKDLKINSSDLLQVASNTCAAKAGAGGCGKNVCKLNVY